MVKEALVKKFSFSVHLLYVLSGGTKNLHDKRRCEGLGDSSYAIFNDVSLFFMLF